MKSATIALAIQIQDGVPQLLETFSDGQEIVALESAMSLGEDNPLEQVYAHRERQRQADEDFSDYVENLLSKPFVRPEIQEHGLQWLRSRIRIEEYLRSESEAARIIANYALQIYMNHPEKTDFLLVGPNANVRVRIFILSDTVYKTRSA